MENLFALLMSWLIAGIAAYSGFSLLRAGRRVSRWPTVAGTVVDRGVVLSTVASPTTPGRRYRATVRYSYEVDGNAYEGDRIFALGGVTGSQAAMQKEIDGFDGPVTVRYNPENPAEACLRAAPAWWAVVAFAGAVLSLLVGLVTLVSMLASRA